MKKSLGPQTLIYPTPVWCVGTYDQENVPNIMTIAWGGICCSNPPCVGVSLRKATYTYGSILDRKAFTVNVPSQDYVREADYFGIVSGRDRDKFRGSKLTPVRSDLVDAPYVDEFPMVLECRLMDHFEIGSHTQFVGEILDVKVNDNLLGEDGKPDMRKISPIVYAAKAHRYHGVGIPLGEAFEIGKEIG